MRSKEEIEELLDLTIKERDSAIKLSVVKYSNAARIRRMTKKIKLLEWVLS